MKKILILAAIVAVTSTGIVLAIRDHNRPAYLKRKTPIETRVEDLLSRMTLDEKIGQMVLVDKNSIPHIPDTATYGIGGILSGGGAKPEINTPRGWRDMVDTYSTAARASRLGIPILYGVDAIHGNTNVPGATIFPHAIGLGATRDSALVQRIAQATGEETLATHISWNFAPNLDAPEDIRWGRVYETFSSDATINAELGAAYVRGMQHAGVAAAAKHYLGVGGMRWGSAENKDYKIDQGTTPENEKVLRNIYLPPFKSAVDAGVLTVMAGLNRFGDHKISANRYLLTDILKTELNFTGFVVSDWFGINGITHDPYRATVAGINAGIDMAMLPFDYATFFTYMKQAYARGDITEARINDAVRRILRVKFATGLFDQKHYPRLSVLGPPNHRQLAREAVQKSLVLLKNEHQAVPITQTNQRILVAGSAAHNTGRQSGGWTIEWQGVDTNTIPGATSILDGIKQAARQSTVLYNERAEFPNDTPIADIGIAVVGEKPYAEGVGDTAHPTLSPEDLATIKELKKLSKKIVVIIVSGRPLLLPDDAREWDALIAAWLPGSEGDGVADVLFGKQPFTGTLPVPWPKNLQQLPFSPDGIAANAQPPLFHKGFGL